MWSGWYCCTIAYVGAVLLRDCVWVFYFQEWTHPSFPLEELGTFALFDVPAFQWGTFVKMKVVYLKC